MYKVFPLVSAKTTLVQPRKIRYVSGNSQSAGDILRVLQALNPDATDPKGGWWAKNSLPLKFPLYRAVATDPIFPHVERKVSKWAS